MDENDAEVVPLLQRRPGPEPTERRIPPPDERRRSKVAAAERRHKVIQATLAGMDPEAIAERMEMKPAQVRRIITDQLNKWQDADARGVTELREMQIRRLERLITAVWADALGGTVEGRKRPPNLKAVAEVRALTLAQAEIAGTKAPKRIEVGGEVGLNISMDELNDLDAAWAMSGGDVLEGSIAEIE